MTEGGVSVAAAPALRRTVRSSRGASFGGTSQPTCRDRSVFFCLRHATQSKEPANETLLEVCSSPTGRKTHLVVTVPFHSATNEVLRAERSERSVSRSIHFSVRGAFLKQRQCEGVAISARPERDRRAARKDACETVLQCTSHFSVGVVPRLSAPSPVSASSNRSDSSARSTILMTAGSLSSVS